MIPFGISANSKAPKLPSDTSHWLDGKPLAWENLQGKVVLLNVWTFACWNSYRSLPWVTSLKQKFPGLVMIGVHSPEFSYEKDRQQMRSVMAKYKVDYPQILDDGHEYWKKLNNQYWPAFYIVDKHGEIRGAYAGETHLGDSQAATIERLIETLTKESF
jgi:hypothetical protein